MVLHELLGRRLLSLSVGDGLLTERLRRADGLLKIVPRRATAATGEGGRLFALLAELLLILSEPPLERPELRLTRDSGGEVAAEAAAAVSGDEAARCAGRQPSIARRAATHASEQRTCSARSAAQHCSERESRRCAELTGAVKRAPQAPQARDG